MPLQFQRVVIGLCKRKETAALKIKAAVSNRRENMSALRRLFFFCRRPADYYLLSKKEPITANLCFADYRLCVCASGSLITVILNCFTWIKVSCLHFGQNSGKFLSSVSFRIFNLVLFPQTGHNIQFSLSIFYYSPFILLLTIRGSELLQLLRLRTFHSRLYLQDNHWHTVLLFPL